MSTTSSVCSSTFQNRANDPSARQKYNNTVSPLHRKQLQHTKGKKSTLEEEWTNKLVTGEEERTNGLVTGEEERTNGLVIGRKSYRAPGLPWSPEKKKRTNGSPERAAARLTCHGCRRRRRSADGDWESTFTGAPCFPISAIASPNSPTVEASFCKIPATLSTLDDGIFNAGSAATGG
nr:hypothetical protein Iba_chr05cCG10850 [Ipomoea batatas]